MTAEGSINVLSQPDGNNVEAVFHDRSVSS